MKPNQTILANIEPSWDATGGMILDPAPGPAISKLYKYVITQILPSD